MRFIDRPQINGVGPIDSNSSIDLRSIFSPLTALDGWKTLALIFTTVIILFTVCGNAMTLYAVCKMKTFQNSISNIYIASLAAADLIVGAFVMTFMMLYTIAFDGRWIFGRVMCDIWQTLDFISCTISLYSICAIGFDRWLNLEKPLRIFKRNRFTAKRALAFVWIAPTIIWIPIMIGFRLKNGPSIDNTCSFVWDPTYVVPVVAIPLFYIPVLTLMILFVRISLVIRSHLVFLHKHSNQNTNTSLFDFDRSIGGSALGSTPASSRRRSANTLAGSTTNLKHAGSLVALINSNATCQLQNGTCCRTQKSKPPPLSPIVSVNLTAAGTGSNPTAGPSDTSEPTVNQSSIGARGQPNQSPLALKVLRERLSPKMDLKTKKLQEEEEHSAAFCFESADSDKNKTKSGECAPKETTPLLRPCLTDAAKSARITGPKPVSMTGSTLDLVPESPPPETAGTVSFQIGPTDDICTPKRSASPDCGVVQAIKAELINRHVPSPIDQSASDLKRSSVTSDTAVFFTKRFLSRQPPLIRAKTEIVLETTTRPKPRPSARFSIVAMTSPLFSRKYSMNLFSDMFPQCAGGITQQIRAAKAVGVILIFFLISWAPFLILWPLKTFCPDRVSDRLYQLSIWANYFNSTLNPILYTLCSPRFQRVFRKHCNRCSKAGRGVKSRVERKNKLLSNGSRRNV